MANLVRLQTSAIARRERQLRDVVGNGPASDFLLDALRRFKMAKGAEERMREAQLEDYEFMFGKQWDPADLANRRADSKPSLIINRIPQFIRQITNQMRASRMAIQVNPVDSAADVSTAEALQGVIRNIENNSDGDIIYANAGEHQCSIGRGAWRLLTEWAEDDEFEQNIVMRGLSNPFSAFFDPAWTMHDASDIRFAFVVEHVPSDDFEDMHGTEHSQMYNAFMSRGLRDPDWTPEKGVLVAEYMYLDTKEEEIAELQLPDPQNPEVQLTLKVSAKDLPREGDMPKAWKVIQRRTVTRKQCKWAKITPVGVLEGNDAGTGARDFPSKYIPVVQCMGETYNIDGKRDMMGMVRFAKQPQQMYNYWASALTEMIGLSPRMPYIGYEGQFKGHEKKWNNANRRNFAYLEVAAVTIGGQPAPLPQRAQYGADISSLVSAFQLADNDLKAVMGLFDASLGQQGPEQSGKAILARQRQGEIGNSNYLDNMSRAIRLTGKILLDMIPRVLTPTRVLRILGADNNPTPIIIHTGAPAKDVEALQAATGIAGVFDISIGRYDVNIGSGPNYASRRQEAVVSILELLDKSKDPRMAQAVADILVRNMDWPGAQEIAARLNRMVPADLLGPNEKQDRPPKLPPEVQKKMKEMEQELEELRTGHQAKMAKIQSDHEAAMAKAQSQQQIQTLNAQNQVRIAAQRAESASAMEQMTNQFEQMMEGLRQRHEAQMQQAELSHEEALQEDEQQHEVALARTKAQTTKEVAQTRAEAQKAAAKIAAKAKPKKTTTPSRSSRRP